MSNHRVEISLIIPAWNEARYLPRLLATVQTAVKEFRAGPQAVQLIVADNNCTDDTAKIAEARGCQVVPVRERCIAAARNGGARVAVGDLLCFCDADMQIHPQTLNYVHAVMRTGEYIGGGTGLVMERWSPGIAATWYLMVPALNALGLDGGVWFCRRDDFEQLGGYDESFRAGEDVLFLWSLKRLGRTRHPVQRLATRHAARRHGLTPALATCSTRKFDQHGDWYMLRLLPSGAIAFLWSRQTLNKLADRYWYQSRTSD